MCEDHGASQKALDAIKHLYVEINNLTLDTDLLARLYEVYAYIVHSFILDTTMGSYYSCIIL